jgi:hypothetical protein
MRARAFIGAIHAATKKSPRRLARACGAVRVNTEFFEDSVTRSQAFYLPRESKARFSCKQQEKYRRVALDTFWLRNRRL